MKTGSALIQEVNACNPGEGTAAFWWLGQIGFILKLGKKTIYLDAFLANHPDRKIPPLLQPEEVTNADYIFGSHDHIDHIDREVWYQMSISSPQAQFIVPRLLIPSLAKDLAIPEKRFIGLDDDMTISLSEDIRISGVAAAHEFLDRDSQTGAYPYLGCVIEGNGCRVYHSGDTCVYEGLYGRLRKFGKMDVMFLPINGRDGRRYKENTIGNMTYQEAVDMAGTLKPNLVVPSHYEMFEGNQENPQLFADYISVKYPDIHYWIGEHGEMVWYK